MSPMDPRIADISTLWYDGAVPLLRAHVCRGVVQLGGAGRTPGSQGSESCTRDVDNGRTAIPYTSHFVLEIWEYEWTPFRFDCLATQRAYSSWVFSAS